MMNFINNVINSPVHLAFSVLIIVVVAIVALIAMARTNKHRGLNHKFIPSGFTTLAFATNTIIWIVTQSSRNIVNTIIMTLSLVLAILVSASRIEAKAHKLSEVIFSACVGIILVLCLYGIAYGITRMQM